MNSEHSTAKKAMVVAPHPDDAELAMGGTVVKMLEAGWQVILVDLTDGEPTPFGSKQIRQREAAKACKILGLTHRVCLDMPNCYLQARLENRRKLAETIRLHTPAVLFGPARSDYHPDHTAAAELVEAARFEAKFHKTDMAGRPHWVPRQFYYYSIHRREYRSPSFIVDVTNFWQRKLDAIKAYHSQLKNRPAGHPLSVIEQVETVGRYFGWCIGTAFGEPFLSREPVRLDSLDWLVPSYDPGR